jgi:hypothetical protein
MRIIRRIFKALLLTLAAIVALLVLALGGLWAYAAIDKEDTFALQSSEFDDASYLRKIDSSKVMTGGAIIAIMSQSMPIGSSGDRARSSATGSIQMEMWGPLTMKITERLLYGLLGPSLGLRLIFHLVMNRSACSFSRTAVQHGCRPAAPATALPER